MCLNLEKYNENNIEKSVLMEKYYKPDFSIIFNKIKGIRTPVKNDLLITLSTDGQWHSETRILRKVKAQKHLGGQFGAVTLATMMESFNNLLKSNYVEKQFINGEMNYKIADNYVGLTRAAYNKHQFSIE